MYTCIEYSNLKSPHDIGIIKKYRHLNSIMYGCIINKSSSRNTINLRIYLSNIAQRNTIDAVIIQVAGASYINAIYFFAKLFNINIAEYTVLKQRG